MKFALMLPAAIEADWERIGAAIQWPSLFVRLQNETAFALSIKGTDAILFISVGTPGDAPDMKALWAIALVGNIGWRPHSNHRLLCSVIADCETLARALGCSELRIEMGDRPRWKRPVLGPLGFECQSAGGVDYMKKDVRDG